MTGPAIGAADILARLKSILPARWFGDVTPVLDAVLSGGAAAWAQQFALLDYARAQTRITTATDLFLDLIGQDFFGPALGRRTGEPDAVFRDRILRALRRERVTRPALSTAVTEASGAVPGIFEPGRATDTGAYGAPGRSFGFAYGVAGRWGSNALPFQAFVDATLPPPLAPVRQGPGFGSAASGYGGRGQAGQRISYGSTVYTDPPARAQTVADAITGVMPAATIAWLRIAAPAQT